jgi:hypothetical protein
MFNMINNIVPQGVPNCFFPTDNEWGIPCLDPRLQADYVDCPVNLWGTFSRSKSMRGTYLFYVDDYRFTGLWKFPDKVVHSGCVTASEPNITVTLDTPKAYVITSIYCKRWIARYWQENGIRILVDLNVPTEFNDLNFLGVPYGWRAYCTHGYSDRLESLELEYRSAIHHAGTPDILWVVYGGGRVVKIYCEKRSWIYIPEHRDRIKGRFTDDFMLLNPNFTQNRTRESQRVSVSY